MVDTLTPGSNEYEAKHWELPGGLCQPVGHTFVPVAVGLVVELRLLEPVELLEPVLVALDVRVPVALDVPVPEGLGVEVLVELLERVPVALLVELDV
jgi:hypothetical protein